jgi:beta-glucosidase
MTTDVREFSVPTRENRGRPFPSHFLFGAATAAYQIEGAALEGGRRDSIWDAFSRVPGAVINADNGDVACDHYHLYRDDVALMKSMGLQTYRFSTSWSRVRPDGGALNREGVDFYKRLVDELLDADILPWLTLYHWDLPQALQERGGWTVRDTAERFTEYALDMHDALGDRVNVWTTLNEPWCSSFLSYTAGLHAPGHYSRSEGMLAAHHLLLGHGQAVKELRARDSSLNLGITLNLTVADPVDAADPADVDAARRIDGQFNRWFLDPIFRGVYPQDIFDEIADGALRAAILPGDLEVISTPIDTLGVNYYHGEFVGGHAPDVPPIGGDAPTDRRGESPFPSSKGIFWHERGLPRTPMHWEVQPEGLTRLLVRVSDEYAKPAGTSLFVTENGAAYDDEPVIEDGVTRVHDAERVDFVRDHLGAILDAVDAGVDVRGYFYWSLLDNFEWAWGYEKRFGIVRVDYETQERSVKDSGREYARIIAVRELDDTGLDTGGVDDTDRNITAATDATGS